MLNFHSVIKNFSDFAYFFKRWRNKRIALRSLKKILKASLKLSDQDFAGEIEKAMRNYLVHRFDEAFASLTTNKFVLHFYELTGDTLSLGQSISVENLTNLFVRLDYIRFAKDSIDSMRLPENQYKAAFDTGERERTVKSLQEIISFFERPERNRETEVKQNA